MCDGNALNPFKQNKWAMLTGLPIAGGIASPKWIKQHPKEAVALGALAATVFSGGAAAGLWGGLGAAGAGAGAAAGAAGAGEAIGAGAGALTAGSALAEGGVAGLGGGTAGLFGPSAAGANMLSTFAPSGLSALSTATPTLAEIGAGANMASFGLPALGESATAATPGIFSQAQGAITNLVGGPENFDRIGKGLEYGNKGMKIAQLASPQHPQISAPAPARPAQQQPTQSNSDILGAGQQRIPQPGDPDYPQYLEWLKRKKGGYGY